MKITVVGVGYVGLVSAVGLAEIGNTVICLSRDERKIRRLRRGIPTIYEPGLDQLLQRNLKRERISFTADKRRAIQSSDIIVVAVGTPPGADGSADLEAVWSVGRDIAAFLDRPKIVVTKSTVPVGTGERLKTLIRQGLRKRGRDARFDIVSNPEFLREGAALKEFLEPDRVVVGVENKKTAEVMAELYRPITRPDRPLVITDVRSSELIKYAANSFLAAKISFINEISRFCDRIGADVVEVARGIGLDSRIGPQFLQAGIGYGGSCFPKDVSALIESGRAVGFDFRILQAVQAVNEDQRTVALEKLTKLLPKLKGRTVAVWGLSFKPRTDDVREAPSIAIIGDILRQGGRVSVYDPVAVSEARKALPRSKKIRFAHSQYDVLKGADALIVVTEWDEFRLPDFQRVKRMLASPIIVDGRNIYNPQKLRRLGFRYASIGRP